MTNTMMMSTRRLNSPSTLVLLALDPPRHWGLAPIILAPGRHLIGSSDECGIRLQADGILDRHVLVLVGEHRTVVKSIDSRTWVNEGPVTETALRPGDRLSVGPLTFRVRTATADEVAAVVLATSDAVVPTIAVADVFVPPVVVPRPSSDLAPEAELPAVAPIDVAATVAPVAAPPEPADVQTTETPVAETAEGPDLESLEIESFERLVGSSMRAAAPGPRSSVKAQYDPLDWRLEEIHQRLVELRQTTDLIVQPVVNRTELAESDERHPLHQLRLRHEELQRRADQIAAESRALQERTRLVTERESQVEQRHQQLRQEAARIATVAQTARQGLAEEHTQHVAVWQEWEASYQRMTAELAEQLDAIEQQRESLQAEADRLAAARTDLQNQCSDQERGRQLFFADQVKLANELADVAALRVQIDSQARQQRLDAEDTTAQLEAQRRELYQLQAELQAEKQELGRERHNLAVEWSAHVKRVETENQHRVTLQVRMDDESRRLLVERDLLSKQTHDLARDRAEFDALRLQFDGSRLSLEESQRELQALSERHARTAEELDELRQLRDAERQAVAQTRERELRTQAELQSRLDADRRQLHQDLQELEELRRLLDTERSALAEQRASELDFATPVETVSLPFAGNPAPESVATDAIPQFSEQEVATEAEELRHEAWSNALSDPLVFPVLTVADRFDEPVDSANDQTVLEVAVEVPSDEDSRWNLSSSISETAALPTALSPTVEFVEFESTSQAVPVSTVNSADALLDAGVEVGSPEAPSQPDDPWARALGGSVTRTMPAPAGLVFETTIAIEAPWPQITEASMPQSRADVAHDILETNASQPSETPNPEFVESEMESPQAVGPTTDEVCAPINVHETLAEVNREFGTPAEANSPPPLPSWWVENPTAVEPSARAVDVEHPSWVVDAMRSAPVTAPEPAADPGTTTDLRAKLAMLFDLPRDAQETSATVAINEPTPEVPDALPPTEETPTVVETEPATLSAEVLEPAAPAENHPDDSVDAFMARLLARSRSSSDDPAPAAAPPVVPSPAIVEPSQKIEPADRSHLMAGPKHKQDKQAVRENLQSFREVAHLSARSALARYSLEQLRNATIVKGVLMGISTVAAVAYIIEPIWNSQMQWWKAAGCTLAAVLALLEFKRSWLQLTRPLAAAAKARNAIKSDLAGADTAEMDAADVADVSSESALEVGTQDAVIVAPESRAESPDAAEEPTT